MPGTFEPRAVSVGGVAYRYQVWLPPQRPVEPGPVILFLHGAGERGDDGGAQTHVGLGPALERDAARWPFIAVFPQCRINVGWRGPMLRQALAALDATLVELNCDPARQHLTGISMGAFGCWRMALEEPDRFAAIVPVCGGLDAPPAALYRTGRHAGVEPYEAAAQLLRALPARVFHGAADRVIPVEESRKVVEVLRAAGAEVHYTEYPGVGHNSWDLAYEEPELPGWLLSRKRRTGC